MPVRTEHTLKGSWWRARLFGLCTVALEQLPRHCQQRPRNDHPIYITITIKLNASLELDLLKLRYLLVIFNTCFVIRQRVIWHVV
jgi:hypothetical protein